VNLDLLNKLLGASASFALIVGVVVAIMGVFVATQTELAGFVWTGFRG